MVGQTLTADTSGISDEDGLNNAVFTYRWYGTYARKTKDLSAQSTYTVQESDIRRQIKLVVSFTDDVGYQERISATPTDAVVPDVRYYFLRTEKNIEEPQSGRREVGTWVYLNDWPRVRSADGTKVHFWGIEPVVPFNIPYTVSYEDGARGKLDRASQTSPSSATQSRPIGSDLQGRSELSVTIKQISKKVNRREVPAGQELGKIVITLDDYLDLPNGPQDQLPRRRPQAHHDDHQQREALRHSRCNAPIWGRPWQAEPALPVKPARSKAELPCRRRFHPRYTGGRRPGLAGERWSTPSQRWLLTIAHFTGNPKARPNTPGEGPFQNNRTGSCVTIKQHP